MMHYCLYITLLVRIFGGLAKESSSEVLAPYSKRLDELHRVSKNHRSFVRIYGQYKYVEHNQSAIIKNYGAKRLNKLRFLHIPKTGTTLAATLVHYCCKVDGMFIDVVRHFNSIVPGMILPRVCDMNCFEGQPRSPNGDPWAHIPYRQGVDSDQTTIAVFRQPESRLASQLTYMQVIGPKLSTTFGFRRLDSYILYHLLTYNYDESLSRYLMVMNEGQKVPLNNPSPLRESAFVLTTNTSHDRLLSYQNTRFIQLAQECVDLQATLRVPAIAPGTLYNLSHSADTVNDRLRRHFGSSQDANSPPAAMESFMQCGMRAAVQYPGLQGCQTRMVLGRNCVDSYTLTAADVAEAKRRLEQEFAFVGITEHWNTSIALFHALYGGALHSDEVVLQRSAKEGARHTQAMLRQVLLTAPAEDHSSPLLQQKSPLRHTPRGKGLWSGDPWDTPLYEHAVRLFERSLQRTKLDAL